MKVRIWVTVYSFKHTSWFDVKIQDEEENAINAKVGDKLSV